MIGRPSRRVSFVPADWTARFITPLGIGAEGDRAPVLSGRIEVPGQIQRARLYATAYGIYLPSINGRRVDDTVLAPGWTSYAHRLRYHVYDVTHLVQPGPNVVEVLLGNGWYRGRLGYTNDRALYGDRLALLAQLEVTTTDGAVHVLATDGTWRAHESEVIGGRPLRRPDDRPAAPRPSDAYGRGARCSTRT